MNQIVGWIDEAARYFQAGSVALSAQPLVVPNWLKEEITEPSSYGELLTQPVHIRLEANVTYLVTMGLTSQLPSQPPNRAARRAAAKKGRRT